jgi:large-conductance mechanosensitive channel
MTDFISYLIKENIHKTVISAIIATQINQTTLKFKDTFIIPFFNSDINGDEEKDNETIGNFKLKVFNKTLKVGEFMVYLLEPLVLFYIIYLFSKRYTPVKL